MYSARENASVPDARLEVVFAECRRSRKEQKRHLISVGVYSKLDTKATQRAVSPVLIRRADPDLGVPVGPHSPIDCKSRPIVLAEQHRMGGLC